MSTYARCSHVEGTGDEKPLCDTCSRRLDAFDDDGFTCNLPEDRGYRVWTKVYGGPCSECGKEC